MYEQIKGILLQQVQGADLRTARAILRLLAVLPQVVLDYSPNQPRDKNGRWTSGGAGGTIGKTKYAPSPRANRRGITVSEKTFGILRGEFNTWYPNAEKGERKEVSYQGRRYLLESDGDGSVIVLNSRKET